MVWPHTFAGCSAAATKLSSCLGPLLFWPHFARQDWRRSRFCCCLSDNAAAVLGCIDPATLMTKMMPVLLCPVSARRLAWLLLPWQSQLTGILHFILTPPVPSEASYRLVTAAAALSGGLCEALYCGAGEVAFIHSNASLHGHDCTCACLHACEG